jgi:hypothetical protein
MENYRGFLMFDKRKERVELRSLILRFSDGSIRPARVTVHCVRTWTSERSQR